MEVLEKNVLDILCVQETKLDDSFPGVQFQVDNFKLYRKDYTQRSGGLLTYVRGDTVQSRREDLEIDRAENGRVESLAVEIMLRGEKWIVVNLYKQPIMSTEVS